MTHSLYHSSVAPFPAMSRPPMPRPPMHRPLKHRRPMSAAAPAASGAPNYLARRAAALAIIVATLAVMAGVFVLLAGLGGRPASASQAEPAISSTSAVHVASAGDTLWSIAEEHHGDIGFDRYVDTLIDLNGGTDLQIGQAVRLP
jgi:LysM domain